MKRQYILSIIILIFLLGSCKKEPDKFDYDIQGVNNLEAGIKDTKTLEINILQNQGTVENVKLSLIDIPFGVSYAFETLEGVPNFTSSLSITVSDSAKLGAYPIKLIANSESTSRTFDFTLTIQDVLSFTIKVYDATKANQDHPSGELLAKASMKVYSDLNSISQNKVYYSTTTDNAGIARFYHIALGNYFFIIDKNGLNNVVSKKDINGKSVGWVVSGIDKNWLIKYRDQNGDGLIDDNDRVQADFLVCDGQLFERVVWIGQ